MLKIKAFAKKELKLINLNQDTKWGHVKEELLKVWAAFLTWIRFILVELPPITEKRWRNFLFCSAGCFLLRDEGFSFGLDVLYWDLEISKLQFLIKKQVLIFSSDEFFKFSEIKPLDPDPDPDPHWRIRNTDLERTLAFAFTWRN